MMETEFISEDLIACRACLATNTDFYTIADGLENLFVQLMDVEFSDDDGLPQHLCACCRVLLLKFHAFRKRCDRSQTLLKEALREQPYISTNDIQSIDRKIHKLSLNLVQLGVYTFDSTIKQENYTDNEERETEDTVNDNTVEETDGFDSRDANKPDDILDEPTESSIRNGNNEVLPVDTTEDTVEKKTLFVEIDGLNGIIKVNTIDNSADDKKRLLAASRKQHKKELAKKKAEKKIEQQERISKLIKYVAGKKKEEKPLTKWQLTQRRPENDFMPNFDHAEFERENDCKIHVLTTEEQFQEIEERRQSLNYLNLEYKCEPCGKGFEFDQSYKNHMLKHDPKAGKFVCNICGVRYRIRSLMLRHVDTHKFKFVCNICSFVTRAKHVANNHYQMHMGKVYRCKHCDATFTKKTSYFGHVRIVHPSTEWSCELCGDTFVGRRGLLFHQARAHYLQLSNKKLKCKKCGVQFVNWEAKDKHMHGQKICDVSLKACGECGEMFADETQLKNHSDEQHVRDTYWCEECSLSFVSKVSLDTHHQRIHLKKKWPATGRNREMNKEYYKMITQRRRMRAQVVCEMCGIKVRSSSVLEKHQESQCKKEKKPKKFKCPHCDRACSTGQGLRIHINTHTGETPFKCSQCPLEFRQAAALKRHQNRVHLGIDSRVTCELCDKSFSTTTTLKLHVNTVHLQMPNPPRRRRRRNS